MNMPRVLSVSLISLITVMTASMALAQRAPTSGEDSITRLNLLIEADRVRFTTADRLEWRLEVASLQEQPIFDSGFVIGSVLDWTLVDAHDQPVPTGVYRYIVTIQQPNGSRTHRGELTVERASPAYHVAVTADETAGGTALAVVEGGPTSTLQSENPAAPTTGASSGEAAALQRHLGRASFATLSISGTGTTSRLTKWIDGPNGVVGDTEVTETNGSVVVGNGTFKGNVHIFGLAADDVFAGMGPDLINGPAFNYGYAAATFGRGAGFFNVRPDALANAPNPSLRFMTANVQRMIITNTGKVGIGPAGGSLPAHQLRIGGGPDWTIDAWKGAIELDNGAAIGWQSNGNFTAGIGHAAGGMYFFHAYNPPGDATPTNAPNYRMVINNGGNVGIGTTSPLQKLHVVGGVQADTVYTRTLYATGPNCGGGCVFGSTTDAIAVSGNATTGVGVYGISTTGYAGQFSGNVYVSGTITQNSDLRLKQDVATLGYGLREILQLRPVTWTWKDRPDRGRQVGVIAQDVKPLMPELVTTGKDEQQTLGVNYVGLLPVAVKAIQEQQATIDALQAENAALKARLAAIEQALQSIGSSRKR